MKTALMQSDKLMIIASFVVSILAVLQVVPAYVAIGFIIGYITARQLMRKLVGQLDTLGEGELPNSNFMFNMTTYMLLFVVMAKVNIYALLASAAGVIIYRKLFFVFVKKNLKEGGFDGNYN